MAIDPYDTLTPRLHPTAYVHPSAQLLGDVELEEDASVWPTAVLRGDNGFVKVGARTNLQDGTICHGTLGVSTTTVGRQVTVGHRVTLHGCTVGDDCLIGMGSILMDNVELGAHCFVAAGSLLTPGKQYPPRSFLMGSPARRVREVSARDLEAIAHGWKTYQELARRYRTGR